MKVGMAEGSVVGFAEGSAGWRREGRRPSGGNLSRGFGFADSVGANLAGGRGNGREVGRRRRRLAGAGFHLGLRCGRE